MLTLFKNYPSISSIVSTFFGCVPECEEFSGQAQQLLSLRGRSRHGGCNLFLLYSASSDNKKSISAAIPHAFSIQPYRFKEFVIIVTLLLCSVNLFSQASDSNIVKKNEIETTTIFPDSIFEFNTTKPIPKRAGLYSACAPGLGQLYNKQYLKAGLVYVGGAVIGGFIISNYKEYNKYRTAYIGMIDNDPETPNQVEDYTAEDVKLLRDGFRRYLEYSIIAASVGYILNILDAFISAHLKSFDMSKDISFRTTPYYDHQKQLGIKLSFALK